MKWPAACLGDAHAPPHPEDLTCEAGDSGCVFEKAGFDFYLALYFVNNENQLEFFLFVECSSLWYDACSDEPLERSNKVLGDTEAANAKKQ